MWDPSDELHRGGRAIRRVARLWSCVLCCGVPLGVSACGGEDSGRQTSPEDAADNLRQGNSPDTAAGGSSAEGGTEREGPATGTEDVDDDGPDQNAPTDGDEPGMTEGTTSNTPVSVLEGFLTQYHDWHPRTASPVNVSSEIFTLCRSPTLSEDAFVESEHGDSRMLMDWLNPMARAGFEALGDEGFAPGAAIVKEKLAYREGSPEPALVAIGIMLKHEPGFDSELGDWEFAYWEEEPGLIDGPDQSAYCGGCHASSPTDFVFLDDSWRVTSEEQ